MSLAVRWRFGGLACALACGAGLVQAQEAAPHIPFKTDQSAELPGASQWLLAVLGCVILLAVLLKVVRHLGGRQTWNWRAGVGKQSAVAVLERTQLTANSQLVVARYRDRELLMVVGQNFATCIRDEPVAMAVQSPIPDEGNL